MLDRTKNIYSKYWMGCLLSIFSAFALRQLTKFNGHNREIELRHLPILGRRVYIRIRPKRYECPHCGGKTTTQKLDWYESKSPHTKAYDRHLMLNLINSTIEDVSHKENVGYKAVLVLSREKSIGMNTPISKSLALMKLR